jgi:hypothetical protein
MFLLQIAFFAKVEHKNDPGLRLRSSDDRATFARRSRDVHATLTRRSADVQATFNLETPRTWYDDVGVQVVQLFNRRSGDVQPRDASNLM